MPKTVPDIVYERPTFEKIAKIGLYMDYYDTDGSIKVGKVVDLDLEDQNGLKYQITPYNRNFACWYNDHELLGVHKFPKRKNG